MSSRASADGSRQPLLAQLNFNILMKSSPIFIFLFGNTICKASGYSNEAALFIPGMVGAAVLVLYLYWDFGNRNQSTAFLPLNMTVVWDAAKAEDFITTIVGLVPLNDKTSPYSYAVKFDRPLEDDKGEDFERAIFISNHPIDKTLRRIPKQFIAYGGSVFEGMAARIVATYTNEFEDILGFHIDEQRVGEFRVFHVKWCLEDSKLDQISLGLYKEEPLTNEIIKTAVQLEIDRKAQRLGVKNRELEGKVTVFSEAYKDVRTKSYESVNRLIDDIDRIKQERQGTITRMLRDPKVRLILAVIAAAAVLYVLRYYKVIN